MGVSGNYFSVLRVRPRLGRTFTREDDGATSPPVGVISWRYFQSRFGGDPAALGKVIQANGLPLTIVGVVPPGFHGVQEPLREPPDIFFPLALDAEMRASTGRSDGSLLTTPTAWWLQVMGRLRPDATAAGVHARLDGVFQRSARAGLDEYLNSLTEEERGAAENRNLRDIPRLLVDSGRRGLYDVQQDAIASAVMLNAVVALVLLIICANVANLMLSRAIIRRKEIAVRLSLGATRGRLIGQLLIESLVLSAIGAALGLAVAWWGVGLLPEPASAVSVFHWRTFAFMAASTVLTTLLFGIVPAVRTTDVKVNSGLLESGRRAVPRRSVLGRSLLVVQVALSLVLLVSAGLFLQTLVQLRRVDPGFDTRNLLLVSVMPQASGYDMPRSLALYRTLLEQFQSVPGVRGVALTQPALLSGSVSTTNFYAAGQPVPADPRNHEGHEIHRVVVSPEFFKVLGIPILRGRGISPGDHSDAPRIAVINEAAATRFLPGEDPIGQRFGTSPDRTGEIEIVGLARNAKYSDVREPAPPTMYVSYLQAPRATAVFALRTHGTPDAVAGRVGDVVRRVDPNLPLVSVMTQHQAIERRLAQERLFAQACSLFGGIALLLASVGLFGLMSYSVARRTAEMGVRMALGAQRRSVVRMIMVESMWLVGIGLVAGLALTAVASRLIATLLFGVPPYHLGTIAGAAALLVTVCAAAAFLPARRASLVDPLVALRYE
jgi:predicted permease